MFLSCFTSLTYFVLCILVILNVWEKIHVCLGGSKFKTGEEKLKNPSDKPWSAAPTIAPNTGSVHQVLA